MQPLGKDSHHRRQAETRQRSSSVLCDANDNAQLIDSLFEFTKG
jgi:hypothetical protein